MTDPEQPDPEPPTQPAGSFTASSTDTDVPNDGTWEVGGVSEEARAAAHEAAAQAGLPVGVWLDSVVAKAAPQEMGAVSTETIVAALDALGDRIAHTEATTRQTITPLHDRLDELSQQLVEFEQMAELADSLDETDAGSDTDDVNQEFPGPEAPKTARS